MFDIFRLKEVLVQYKKVFVSEQWPNEKFQDMQSLSVNE